MGVRLSSSPVMIRVGVLTLPTCMSEDSASQSVGSSQNGFLKNRYVKNGMSVSPAMLIQSVTGQRPAAAAKRFVWVITQLDNTPPPLQPDTYMRDSSTMPCFTTASTPAI